MLKLENISFTVPCATGGRTILQGMNLDVPEGKIVVVTGPNGGGKSTLAKLIAGIETPTSGRILLDGADITAKSITERSRLGIGYAFQQPVRFKGVRVLDLLRLAAKKPLDVDEACKYLAAVGLCAQDYVEREVNSSLSGGELKRIEIATVFAKASKVSIFDEPEAGIDLWSFQSLIAVFKEMRHEIKGGSIMIISHQERILNIADEIVVLKDGGIFKQGTRAAVLPMLVGTPLAVGGCPKGGQGRSGKC